MGKRLIQQARGKGGPTYTSPSFRFKGQASLKSMSDKTVSGEIIDLVKCPGHSSPLVAVKYEDGETSLCLAPEGIRVGDKIDCGPEAEIKLGNTLPLTYIPEGTLIHNIEIQPGDGGRFCRSSGGFAKVIGKMDKGILVQLPSKKQKLFQRECRATIGMLAGGGRKEKPFLKAGTKYHAMRAKNKLYPKVSGVAQNAVDHPFGGTSSSNLGRPQTAPKHAPPGRKVGKIKASRTGRKKR